jgi:HEAT repeat protein
MQQGFTMSGNAGAIKSEQGRIANFRHNQERLVKKAAWEFEGRRLPNIKLVELLEKPDQVEKMAAARVLGNRRANSAVAALSDALQENRQNMSISFEIVNALEKIHTTEAVSGLFFRLFDDTNEFVQAGIKVALAHKGHSALQRIEIEKRTVHFHNLLEEHSISEESANITISEIEAKIRSKLGHKR